MKTSPECLLIVFCFANALALTTSPSQASNILVDPGFETQSDWDLFNGATYSMNFARSGSWSIFDATVNNVPGSFEQFAASPGMQFDLTGYALTPAELVGSPAFGFLEISYFDSSNNNLGTVETSPGNAKTSAQINLNTTPTDWTLLDTGIATAPANTAYLEAFNLYVDFSGNHQGVYFDDLSLARVGVPEPTSLTLAGMGAVSLLLCRTARNSLRGGGKGALATLGQCWIGRVVGSLTSMS